MILIFKFKVVELKILSIIVIKRLTDYAFFFYYYHGIISAFKKMEK